MRLPARVATVAVIAKEPIAGRVKTRLIGPGINAGDAAMLAKCCIWDTLSALAPLEADTKVLVLDGSAGPWLDRREAGWTVQPQTGGELDERLSSAFDSFGHGPALLVGMDTPQLRAHHLAFDAATYDACLGLAADGGFWAIGFSQPARARSVVRGVPMSQPDTGARQLARMQSAGMRVQLLPVLTDIDTVDSAQQVCDLVPDSQFGTSWRALHTPGWQLDACGSYSDALRDGADLRLVTDDGRVLTLEIKRYLAAADENDATVLERVIAPVLDIGCGPGRIVHALTAAGLPALGVDIAHTAVQLTAERGGQALCRSIFQPIPGEGRWPTVLVLDGNIGIGGDVEVLLKRMLELLAPSGQLIVETSSQAGDEVLFVRLSNSAGGQVSGGFAWAVLDRASLIQRAARVGLSAIDQWSAGGREFLRLVRAGAVRTAEIA